MISSQQGWVILGWWFAAVFLLTWIIAELIRRYARRAGWFDIPNARSSHANPTPRGGGLAIVLSFLSSVAALAASGQMAAGLAWALLLAGGSIALVGGLDDRRGVSALLRFATHCGAAFIAVRAVGYIDTLSVGQTTISLGLFGIVLTVVCIVWFVNLFNFMDGIDGIATTEAIFLCFSSAVLSASNSGSSGVVTAMLLLACSCLGFLPLNWSPARLFMGDVGSGFLGAVIAILALSTIATGVISLWTWLILTGTFLVDATVTLMRRLGRGEKVYEAHRSHAYQWLTRRWRSHSRVTLIYLAIDLFWLLPWAWFSMRSIQLAPIIAAGALAPLILCGYAAGAGRQELSSVRT